MNYTYAKKDFEIVWNDDGKFECKTDDFHIIKDTPDEVKAEIRAQTEKEKELPRVTVLLLSNNSIVEASTNLKKVYSRYSYGDEIWVSWKEGKSTERKKIKTDVVYADTPENRALLNKFIELRKQYDQISRQSQSTLQSVEKVKAILL